MGRMGGIEQGGPEGIATPEALGMPELLSLVEAQLSIRQAHEKEWRDSEYCTSSFLDDVFEKISLSEESQELLTAQVDNLEETRQGVQKILESRKSPDELLREIMPEFDDLPPPDAYYPTPFSINFLFDSDNFGRLFRPLGYPDGLTPRGLNAWGANLYSEILKIPVSFIGEPAYSEEATEYSKTLSCLKVMFRPEETDLEKFNTGGGF